MPASQTISRNRFFASAAAPATISGKVAGTGFTVVAFLDRELEDVKSWPSDKLRSPEGVSRKLEAKVTHVLEFIVAFTSMADSTAEIACTLVGADEIRQVRTSSVTGRKETIARVSFHAPLV